MRRRPTFTRAIGAVTYGPPENDADTIDALADELRARLRECRVARVRRRDMTGLLRWIADSSENRPATTTAGQLEALREALEYFSPPYCAFGIEDGEYGYWPMSWEEIQEFSSGAIVKRDAGRDTRDLWGTDDVYLVNDHGNVTCGRYDRRGQFHEYWGVV